MKTNYPLKSKSENKNRFRFIITVGVFVLLTFFAFVFPNFSKGVSYTFSRPVWIVEGFISSSFSYIKNFFTFKHSLIVKNLALEEQLTSLTLKETDYDILLRENEELKNELGRESSRNKIIVKVLSKPPRSPYDTVVVDAGSEDGLTLGSKVYMGENIIVGFVTNVTPHTSLVELFSNGNRKQESMDSRTGASFTLVGQGGANLKLEVPKDTDILWGDLFMYPSLSSAIIGFVHYVDSNSQSSFKTIYLRIPGNVFSAKYFFIEK